MCILCLSCCFELLSGAVFDGVHCKPNRFFFFFFFLCQRLDVHFSLKGSYIDNGFQSNFEEEEVN